VSPVTSPLSSRRTRLREFSARVYQKAAEDDIFFMAGAISYSFLIAVVPLFLLVVGLWGYVLRARYGEPSEVIVGLLQNYVPAMGGDIDLLAGIDSGINGLVASRAGYSIVGSLLFIWLATRLVSTLRVAFRVVFDIAGDRGVFRGKIFDLQVVVLGGVLLLLNVVITVVLQSVGGWGTELLGIPEDFLGGTQRALATLLAFMSTWALFALIYWYVPARRISWRASWVAATVMAVSYEVMKWVFGWYVTSVADYSSAYGNLATLVVLLFWIYYASVVFVLSGEIAQVYTMRKARKVQIRTAFGGST
jgi:membrane protein